MKTTVIYHKADFDGIFCYQIAKKFLGTDNVEYIGWDYGDPNPTVSPENRLYILDLSVPGLMGHPKLVWIDHHKSAIDKYNPSIVGYRVDGVAACRLAWQWFSLYLIEPEAQLGGQPDKNVFIDRKVAEPEAVRLVGEFDVWDKRDPHAETFQFGLRSKELTDEDWRWLLTIRNPNFQGEYELAKTFMVLTGLLKDGKLLERYQRLQDAKLMKHSVYVKLEGLNFLALNTARCNSLAFAALDHPETGHDALMGFYWTGDKWRVSLYHAKHRTDIDLSAIAVKYGGGGHRGACGFQTDTLPFWVGRFVAVV